MLSHNITAFWQYYSSYLIKLNFFQVKLKNITSMHHLYHSLCHIVNRTYMCSKMHLTWDLCSRSKTKTKKTMDLCCWYLFAKHIMSWHDILWMLWRLKIKNYYTDKNYWLKLVQTLVFHVLNFLYTSHFILWVANSFDKVSTRFINLRTEGTFILVSCGTWIRKCN